MKKKTIFLFFALLICLNSKAQIAFYDAIKLKEKFEKQMSPENYKEICSVLASYLPQNIDTTNDLVRLEYFDNPFIYKLSIASNFFSYSSPNASEQVGKSIQNALSSLGGLDVTNLADGLAKFLVKRTKEELSMAFFDKFKKFINEQAEFKILFPNTTNTLNAIDKDIYLINNYINTLRESFNKDLETILERMPEFLAGKAPDPLKGYLIISFNMINQLKNGVHPAEVIENLSYETSLPKLTKDIIKVFSIFSKSIRSKDPNKYWISCDSLQFLKDPITLQIYLGLVYQQNKDIEINNKKLSEYMIKEQFINKIVPLIQEISYTINTADLLIKSIKQKQTDDTKALSYYSYLQNSVKMLNSALKIHTLLDLNNESLDTLFYKKLEMCINLFCDINERKFNAAIIDMDILLSDCLGKDYTDKWRTGFIKYGTFIANVAQAKSSDDVEQAIEAVALPAGSSRIKRETSFNVSLNSYLGLFYGREYIKGTNNNPFLNSYGIMAPIGVAASFGGLKCCCSNKASHSLSIFVSVIDIGALASFRFKDDSTSSVPEIKLKDIISPGIFLSWGIAKTPLSLSIGVQMGPLLRKVDSSVNTFVDNKYTRYSLSLAVDIPLLNLYTKPIKNRL